MFYQDILNKLSSYAGGIQINNKSYNVFCYADDLILTSLSVTGLQTVINTASRYIVSHGLNFNPTKTICTTFGRCTFANSPHWQLNGPILRDEPNVNYCQLGPRYEGQLTRMAEPIPSSGQSSSYSLTTLSSSSSTDRRAETDRKVITTRIAVAHHFKCRLRRRESCILVATSSQPTLPLHELPPARLVIHRQTSAHERRKGTLSVQSRSGILADFCPGNISCG